jgi:hypothetical protein
LTVEHRIAAAHKATGQSFDELATRAEGLVNRKLPPDAFDYYFALGLRLNVYFEAGVALGLGRPVIWTCREDDIARLPFDTRQFDMIA